MALSAAVQAALGKAANGGGGGRSAALPDNTRVRVVIQPSKKTIGYIEREPYNRDEANPNHRVEALQMRFVVPEGAPHANRNFFASIPTIFEVWSERNNALTVSYQSIGLVTALGYATEDIDEDTLKNLTDREMLGKSLELVLGVEDERRFNPEGDPAEAQKALTNPLYAKRNTVKFINAASGPAPAAVPAGGYASGGSAAPSAASNFPPPAAAPAAPANDPWAAAAAAAAGGTTI